MRSIAALLAVFAAAAATADGGQHCFTGYAYHLETEKFVYTEHHEQTLQGDKPTEWRVTYRRPDGSVLARKTLDFSANEFVPVYRMEIPDEGYVEGISQDMDEGWRLYRREGEDAERKTKPFKIDPPMAADSGFHPFVQANFDKLMAGETVPFAFAAAGRQALIEMKARRIDDTTFEGESAVRFEAELDMWLVNWFVDSLELTYDAEDRSLLEYRGISNMHNDNGKTYPVRVSYYSDKPEVASEVSTECGGG